ncbi:CPBP family intramembrane glutamic endopeptidase [Bifidobacterium thermacidophilum]|uniref:CAAX amino terminal protease family protein n=1 Tax=Bifidobacterium thermacidophilum subsp. thermacidophilum TaxID=79262 RepID=A0A087E329_9BIFI|nr:type II CAAX endopeptidase family protein [Bifidobacterium thermacidophilum]KFJ02180.1 CAAX amino terminal protease family protein [Bifidobacterium thermacidophilum subsp. thermacidophilum]
MTWMNDNNQPDDSQPGGSQLDDSRQDGNGTTESQQMPQPEQTPQQEPISQEQKQSAPAGQPYLLAPHQGPVNSAAPFPYAVPYAVPPQSPQLPVTPVVPGPQTMAYPPTMGYPPIPQPAPQPVPMAQPYVPQYRAMPPQYPAMPPKMPQSATQPQFQTPSPQPRPVPEPQQAPQGQQTPHRQQPSPSPQQPYQPAYSAYPTYPTYPTPAYPAYPPYLPQVFPPAQFAQMFPQQWQAWWQAKRRTQAAKHDYSIIGWALILIIGVWLVGASLVTVGVALSHNGENIPTGLLLLLSNLPLYAIAMPLSLLVFRNVPRLATKRFDMSPGTFIKLFVAIVPIMYIGAIIGNLVSAPFSGDDQDTLESALANTDYFSLFLLTCVCAPIFEEWIFRKEIIDRTRKYGEKTAIVVSALCFGLFHGNVRQFFYAFGLGLIFGYMYVRTSKLWYSMLMHALVNLNGGVISIWVTSQIDDKALMRAMEQSNDAAMREVQRQMGGLIIVGVYVLIMLALFIVGIVILVRNRKRFVFFDAPEQLEQGTGVKTALGNPGMIVFLVVGILMTISALVMSKIPAEGSFGVDDAGSATILLQMLGALIG